MVFESYLRDFLWTKCPRTISCHKTMVAWFFLFQWGWNFNHFLWFWHLWCSFDWSFLTDIFFILFWSNGFFGLGFESLTGISGTVAALVASLLCPWIKFEVNKSYMYIKHSNTWELSSVGKSCPKKECWWWKTLLL